MKRLIDIGKNLKQILSDSNVELVNKGLNAVNSLSGIVDELNKVEINRLPYLLRNEIIELNENDFGDGRKIVSYAFYGCSSLTNAIIPNSITTIGESAFADCTSLMNIFILSSAPPTLTNKNAIPTTTTIHVPVGSGNAYRSATNWSSHSSRIKDDITLE